MARRRAGSLALTPPLFLFGIESGLTGGSRTDERGRPVGRRRTLAERAQDPRVAVLDIVRIGEPVLRAVAEPVGEDELATPGFQRFLDDLIETMRAANGAGLAAPQVGIAKRVFCVEVRDNPRYPYKPDLDLRVLVNPEVRALSDETFGSYEGCLSVPDLRGLLPRAVEVEIAYSDRDGNRVVEEIPGLSAGTFQHEQDHLDGILFVDRVEDTRTLTTWDRRWHEAAFAAEARAIVERWGS